MVLKTILILTTLFLSFGCTQTQCISVHPKELSPIILPVESFVKIEKEITVKGETEVYVGSGSIVAVKEDETIILTAKHVCQAELRFFFLDINFQSKLLIIDIDGLKYDAEILHRSVTEDICLVTVATDMGRPALIVSATKPQLGERVFNMAAPLGTFGPRLLPIFEGFYSGDVDGETLYTIPIQGGSSGSPVLNSNMELIGVLIRRREDMENLAISVTYETLIDFLK